MCAFTRMRPETQEAWSRGPWWRWRSCWPRTPQQNDDRFVPWPIRSSFCCETFTLNEDEKGTVARPWRSPLWVLLVWGRFWGGTLEASEPDHIWPVVGLGKPSPGEIWVPWFCILQALFAFCCTLCCFCVLQGDPVPNEAATWPRHCDRCFEDTLHTHWLLVHWLRFPTLRPGTNRCSCPSEAT